MIKNIKASFQIDTNQSDLVSIIEKNITEQFGYPLRWYIVNVIPSTKGVDFCSIDIEATILSNNQSLKSSMKFETVQPTDFHQKENPVFVHIVPTGIQAAVGGSLGDAMPVNNMLSKLGTLVTHPNSCNGGPLLLADRKSFLYTEGYALDTWSKGLINLAPSNHAQIGVVIDSGVKNDWVIDKTINAVQGFYAHTGANIVGIELTKEAVGGVAKLNDSGAFIGEVENIETVFSAVESLLQKGANRIALFTYVEVADEYWVDYFKELLPNPVGGIEAIISHSVTWRFGIPTAHAPLVKPAEERLIQSAGQVAPPAALEAADPFYVWCVLRGLQDAPKFLNRNETNGISFEDVSAILCPASALGGVPMLMAKQKNIPILAIQQNTTVLEVKGADLNYSNVIEVESYVIAAGILAKAKQAKDFSLKNLKQLAIQSEKELYKTGVKFLENIGIQPSSILRPIKHIPCPIKVDFQ